MREEDFFLNSCFDLERSLNYFSDSFQIETQRENQAKRIKSDSEKQFPNLSNNFNNENIRPLLGLDSNCKTMLRKQIDANAGETPQKEKTTTFVMAAKLEEEKRLLSKHISKIRFFWRGTNVNYPYAFQKVKRIKLTGKVLEEENEPVSGSEKEDEDVFFLEEDFSLKVINPNQKHFS